MDSGVATRPIADFDAVSRPADALRLPVRRDDGAGVRGGQGRRRSASRTPKARTSACCAPRRSAVDEGLARPVLVGRTDIIASRIQKLGLRLDARQGLRRRQHPRRPAWAIDKVTADLREFQLHTAIAAVMELVNDAYRVKDRLYADPEGRETVRFATATAASLIFPFAPHLGAEIYEALEGRKVWEDAWPEADLALLDSDTFTLVVQVNGKRRDQLEVASGTPEAEVIALARAAENVGRFVDGHEVVKEIYVPGKLVNLVVV